MNKRFAAAALAIAASALVAAPQAAQATAQQDAITVTASVANQCKVTNQTDTVAFGAYDPINVNIATPANDITQTYTASYTCTAGDLAYTYSFSSAKGTGDCAMSNGTSNLVYTISDGTNTDYCASPANKHHVGATATGLTQTFAFTFTLPGGQTSVTSGSYTDTNTATIAP